MFGFDGRGGKSCAVVTPVHFKSTKTGTEHKKHKRHKKSIPFLVPLVLLVFRPFLVDLKANHFLNRLSNALRASEGLIGEAWPPFPPPESRVSRSMDARAMKKSHRFRRSFFAIRSGMGCVH